ncbi:MAG: hypothetical protein DHS20C11_02600 [Lysobacteraceae bacterium]|nr:MAG: hypothetical protein DHS20C11_02600 [Xanthomonadaceae bacterium]
MKPWLGVDNTRYVQLRLLLALAIATVVTFDSCLASVAAAAESLENRLLRTIAQAHLPNADGAMGRNRRDYIHVRFQYRAHLHAQLAAQSHDQESLSRFVSALEYAAARQQADGAYDLQIPRYLAGHRASTGDLASGTAFFFGIRWGRHVVT